MNNEVPDYPEVRALKGNKIEPDCIIMDEINKEGWKCLGEIMLKWIEYKSVFYIGLHCDWRAIKLDHQERGSKPTWLCPRETDYRSRGGVEGEAEVSS